MRKNKGQNKENRGLLVRKRIAIYYLAIILAGALVLFLPISTGNKDIDFIDALFVSASAFSDTGLAPFPTGTTFNNIGQVTILVLVMAGGMGIMSFKATFFVLLGRKITSTDRKMISTEQGQGDRAGMVKLIILAMQVILLFQGIFAIIICAHMMIVYDYDFLRALWFGVFHATTAINNAGFDLTGNSLVDFNKDYLLQIYMMILIVIGGLGFPVLVDMQKYYKTKRHNRKHPKHKKHFRISGFSKLSIATYAICTVVGFFLMIITDYNFFVVEHPGLEGIFYNLFQVVSARSAGFASFDLTQMNNGSQLVLALLMFIGAAPASTGGGVRTTTFALVFLFILNLARNKNSIEIFHRGVPRENVLGAFITFTIATFLCGVSALVIMASNNTYALTDTVFEIASAFGTTGLTLNFTPNLNLMSKIMITVCMIIGQLGISNAIILFSRKDSGKKLIKAPEEEIMIG